MRRFNHSRTRRKQTFRAVDHFTGPWQIALGRRKLTIPLAAEGRPRPADDPDHPCRLSCCRLASCPLDLHLPVSSPARPSANDPGRTIDRPSASASDPSHPSCARFADPLSSCRCLDLPRWPGSSMILRALSTPSSSPSPPWHDASFPDAPYAPLSSRHRALFSCPRLLCERLGVAQ